MKFFKKYKNKSVSTLTHNLSQTKESYKASMNCIGKGQIKSCRQRSPSHVDVKYDSLKHLENFKIKITKNYVSRLISSQFNQIEESHKTSTNLNYSRYLHQNVVDKYGIVNVDKYGIVKWM